MRVLVLKDRWQHERNSYADELIWRLLGQESVWSMGDEMLTLSPIISYRNIRISLKMDARSPNNWYSMYFACLGAWEGGIHPTNNERKVPLELEIKSLGGGHNTMVGFPGIDYEQ